MDRSKRLDTETLIKECREGYDASKAKEHMQELELTLELRNKEIHLLNAHLADCKQEATVRILALEESIGKLQRENADLRISVVKAKRLENEKAMHQIKTARAECQRLLQQQQEGHRKAFQILEQKFNEHLKRSQNKSSQIFQLSKDENATLKVLKEQKYNSIQAYTKNLQSEKSQLLIGKREVEKRLQSMRQAYQKMKIQYQVSLNSKEETIIILKGQLEGLKLKQRFLSDQLQQEKRNLSQIRINSQYDREQLTMLNQKLLKQKQELNNLLENKTQEILQLIQFNAKSFSNKLVLPPVESCEHVGLIDQLQRSLRLKQEQLEELRTIISEWGNQIGFDQPITTRLDKLITAATTTERIKDSQFKSLKEKNRLIQSSRKIK